MGERVKGSAIDKLDGVLHQSATSLKDYIARLEPFRVQLTISHLALQNGMADGVNPDCRF
jgi:hypothetical protein